MISKMRGITVKGQNFAKKNSKVRYIGLYLYSINYTVLVIIDYLPVVNRASFVLTHRTNRFCLPLPHNDFGLNKLQVDH